MHMPASELKAHKRDPIALLEIVSLEGRYYIARFYLNDHCYLLTDSRDEPMMFGGASAVRDYFKDYAVERTEIIPPTGTDEMIGMPDSDEDTMRVPL